MGIKLQRAVFMEGGKVEDLGLFKSNVTKAQYFKKKIQLRKTILVIYGDCAPLNRIH